MICMLILHWMGSMDKVSTKTDKGNHMYTAIKITATDRVRNCRARLLCKAFLKTCGWKIDAKHFLVSH